MTNSDYFAEMLKNQRDSTWTIVTVMGHSFANFLKVPRALRAARLCTSTGTEGDRLSRNASRKRTCIDSYMPWIRRKIYSFRGNKSIYFLFLLKNGKDLFKNLSNEINLGLTS
jgi:hypothetical protein